MIESLRLRNFKCFKDETVSLEALTLLTGVNGAGKSSVLQALLVLRQSWQQGLLSRGRLALNGDLVQLGTAQDALYGYAEEEQIDFDLVLNGVSGVSFAFKYDRDADVLAGADVQSLMDSANGLFSESFQYLCAERVGPRNSFATSDFLVRERRQLGTRGELTAHFLATFGKERVVPGPLLRTDAASTDLLAQVEAWLDFISPGTRIRVTSHPTMDAVQLGYQFVSGRDVTDVYRPTNVGFGLTYTLPVLVAVLSAAPGALSGLGRTKAPLGCRSVLRQAAI